MKLKRQENKTHNNENKKICLHKKFLKNDEENKF